MQLRPQQQVHTYRHKLSHTVIGRMLFCLIFIGAMLYLLPTSGTGLSLTPSLSINHQGYLLSLDEPQVNQILITQKGFQPTIFTTTVGIPVTWLNTTESTHILRSGALQRVYLPLVSRDGVSDASTTLNNESAVSPSRDQGEGLFAAILSPGMSFTFTFTATGTFPFYLESAPEFTGIIAIIPESPTATPTETPTETPTATPTEVGPPLPPDPAAVAPPLDQTVATDLLAATSFLYTGDNPIQTGVVSGTIETRRVAVLRGPRLDQRRTAATQCNNHGAIVFQKKNLCSRQ